MFVWLVGSLFNYPFVCMIMVCLFVGLLACLLVCSVVCLFVCLCLCVWVYLCVFEWLTVCSCLVVSDCLLMRLFVGLLACLSGWLVGHVCVSLFALNDLVV